jgi:hypothetical protein
MIENSSQIIPEVFTKYSLFILELFLEAELLVKKEFIKFENGI